MSNKDSVGVMRGVLQFLRLCDLSKDPKFLLLVNSAKLTCFLTVGSKGATLALLLGHPGRGGERLVWGTLWWSPRGQPWQARLPVAPPTLRDRKRS